MADLQALTEHQPWGWLIVDRHKPIENRGWPPPPWMIGQPLAIHAGKTYDAEGERGVRSDFPGIAWPKTSEHTRAGAIIGVVRLAAVITEEKRTVEHPGVISVEEALAKGIVTQDELRWYTGEYGWVLRDAVKLPTPVPARGFQKLWRVPAEILPAVRNQFVAGRERQKAGAA